MEQSFSLKQLLEILIKRLWIILTLGFIGMAIASAITFLVLTPKYSSQAQLVVTLPQTENTNVNDVNSNLQMINTYKDFIVSDLVLNQVEDRLKSDYNLSMTPAQIKSSISVKQNQNSQMFSIIAVDSKATQAAYIANTIANIFKENAKDVLNVDRITIISNAVVETTPVSPNNKLIIIIGLILGMMIGILIAILAEMADRTVKDSQFIVDELGFTILGTVPEVSEKDISSYIKKAQNMSINDNVEIEKESNTEQKKISEETPRRRRSRV
ncbi:YveK family protein [Enterococcus sp. AZ102]|uniref:YveK family protein n=1 Tax=Enterococcus sp. AZ102 TaxID=2774865 RepID=UPI003F22A27A